MEKRLIKSDWKKDEMIEKWNYISSKWNEDSMIKLTQVRFPCVAHVIVGKKNWSSRC
ncbi:hypothetical protein Sjap_008406 [Stephania japonica]|uniref:Uncharacterized protein n=1 Tax=Stephania japonica TaxID=461633 RepID=A0AAP0PBB4_9MAGN